MSAKQQVVSLIAKECQHMGRAARSNKNSPRERMRTRILLAFSDGTGAGNKQIAEQVGACLNTLARVRRRFDLATMKCPTNVP